MKWYNDITLLLSPLRSFDQKVSLVCDGDEMIEGSDLHFLIAWFNDPVDFHVFCSFP